MTDGEEIFLVNSDGEAVETSLLGVGRVGCMAVAIIFYILTELGKALGAGILLPSPSDEATDETESLLAFLRRNTARLGLPDSLGSAANDAVALSLGDNLRPFAR